MPQVRSTPGTAPLPYHERLRDFIAACARGTVRDEGACLEEATRLFRTRDRENAGDVRSNRLLEAGGAMSGVLDLIGEDVPFMCSRGAGGVCLAMVILDNGREDICAEGATPALALLGAWAGGHLAALEDAENKALASVH